MCEHRRSVSDGDERGSSHWQYPQDHKFMCKYIGSSGEGCDCINYKCPDSKDFSEYKPRCMAHSGKKSREEYTPEELALKIATKHEKMLLHAEESARLQKQRAECDHLFRRDGGGFFCVHCNESMHGFERERMAIAKFEKSDVVISETRDDHLEFH